MQKGILRTLLLAKNLLNIEFCYRMEIYNEVLAMLGSIYSIDMLNQQKSFEGSVSIPNGTLSQSYAESNLLVSRFT